MQTIPFLIPIVGGIIGGIYVLLALSKNLPKSEETIFTGAIALGGIAIAFGLSSLDPSDPAKALPIVIEHLRDAVIVNVIGMFYKIVLSKFSKRASSTDAMEINFEPLLEQMANNEKSAIQRSNLLNDTLKNGQEEMGISFVTLNKTLDGVLSELAKGATAEIITALETVIENFNKNLMEQFGENFKQLNEACLKLVVWQKQYMQSIEELQVINKSNTEHLKNASTALELAATRSESFTQSAKNLEMLYENLTIHTERMGLMLERFKEVPKEASDSITKLAGIVSTTQETLEKHNLAVAKKSEESINQFAQIVNTTQEMLDIHNLAILQKSKESVDQLSKTLVDTQESFDKHNLAVVKKSENSVTQLTKTLADTQGEFDKHNLAVAKKSEESVAQLTKVMTTNQETLDKHNLAIAQKSEKFGIWFADQIGTTEAKMLAITANANTNLQNSVTSAVDNISEKLQNSVVTITDHSFQATEAVHTNLNEALEKFAQIINDALIHSLENSIGAVGVANTAHDKVKAMEDRNGIQ